jgi:hypothetical protein
MRWTELLLVGALAWAMAAAAVAAPFAGDLRAVSAHAKSVLGPARDAHGRIARDPRELSAFKKQHPCPATGRTYGSCAGYVVDHVIPLKRGGADRPENMQWQTKAAAAAKDRWE